MPLSPADPHAADTTLYRATLNEAAAAGAALMDALIHGAKNALLAREKMTRDLRLRGALAASLQLLVTHESGLRTAYPKALLRAFLNPTFATTISALEPAKVNFDELELMDEAQVQSSVVMARAQQSATLAAEASLAELNTLICGSLGLRSVRPESNALRPEIYLAALQETIEEQCIPRPTQLDWMAAMGLTLGQELREMYTELSVKLKRNGVVPAGYAVRQNGGVTGSRRALFELADQATTSALPVAAESRSPAVAPQPAARSRKTNETLLTLDKLRRLLAGELGASTDDRPLDRFQDQFARQFENNAEAFVQDTTEFESTVPAALEALEEMQQVDHVVRRLEQRKRSDTTFAPPDPHALTERRHSLRHSARGIAQALSLEVVTLMIEKIASDVRLLAPVQSLVARLEPAFLQLSLVDARLFTDKQHPARVLVQEITHRSLAYRSAAAAGFQAFIGELEREIAPLLQGPIESAAPFEQVLLELRSQWQRAAVVSAQAREEAVMVLRHVEQRNVLAEKIAKDISSHRDAASVPAVVIEFLCGPWAQVVAQARLASGTIPSNADKYQALISALLWSTHPELTRKNLAKLTRLVPLLLSTLREGLETIRYPAIRTAAFLEALMGLHQLAFKANDSASAARALLTAVPPPVAVVAEATPGPLLDDEPWVAPEEVQASNFVQLSDLDFAPPTLQSATSKTAPEAPLAQAEPDVASGDERPFALPSEHLPLGTWMELQVDGQWVRTQLTWASPHGTLFLFTSAVGTSQSMTRRSRDRLVAAGCLRIVSGTPVVDGALNAVAQLALRNSMDISL